MTAPTQSMDDLIQSLFDNSKFLSKLRLFNQIDCFDLVPIKETKSFRTDASDKLEDSHSRAQIDIELLAAEIQQLLTQISLKANKQRSQPIELCGIYKQIQQIKTQINLVTNNLSKQLQAVKVLKSSNLAPPATCVTIQQHKNWEQQILEKLDIIVKRNFHKVQSVFADKLNSLNMSLTRKFDEVVQNSAKVRGGESSVINPRDGQEHKVSNVEEEKQKLTKNGNEGSSQNELSKKLKSAKSLGSLFGFKR